MFNQKLFKLILIPVFSVIILAAISGYISAEEEYLQEWEDNRFDFHGYAFVLNESSLDELYSEEEQEDFTLFFADRELPEDEELYDEEELEQLSELRGSTLSRDAVLQLNENFTLIAAKAYRPFEQETASTMARLDIREVVSINEGRILEDISPHYFLISEEQLIYDDSLRVLPDGSGMIVYILPELETEYVNIELRLFEGNRFIRQILTAETY